MGNSKKKKQFWPRSFPQKPANFVLLRCHFDEYAVIEKKANMPKPHYSTLHHFEGFFRNEEDAWKFAQDKVKQQIIQREGQLNNLKVRERDVYFNRRQK